MKKLITILLILTMSCSQKEECKFPPPPYGVANDVSQYVGNNYKSITYRYHCYNGRYTSVTYSTSNGCKWNVSYFYSTCIK